MPYSSSLQQLQQFCDQLGTDDIVHNPNYVHGLVFAVCACPEIPMPEQWFPWVVKLPGSIDAKKVDELSDILMLMLKEQLSAMRDNTVSLPDSCIYQSHPEQHQLWMQGLVAGHGLLEGTWQQAWSQAEVSKTVQKDLTRCLRMFTTFANTELAVQQANQRGAEGFAEKLPQLAQSVQPILRDYVRLAGDLAKHLPNQFEVYQDKLPTLN